MTLQHISLQTRITVLVLSTALLFGLWANHENNKSALHEANEIFDAQLAHFAQNLMIVVTPAGSDAEQAERILDPTYDFQSIVVFQVWSIKSTPPKSLFRSSNIPGTIATLVPEEGFSEIKLDGERWRYYRQRDAKLGLDVLVGEHDKHRHELAQQVAWSNIAPLLYGLPILALLVMLAIYLGLRPLRKLAESLRRLSPEQLSPITVHYSTKEIAPVVVALNSLLGRVAGTIENERRFTADASHELRTPIAALHAQIQAAQLSGNETERNECLNKALQGAKRMAHLVGQLLTLSRVDELSQPVDLEPVNLVELTRESCAELGEDAISKNIEISFLPEEHPAFSGSPDMLRIMLRNLLDNAIRYTPNGGHVEVALRLADDGQQVELEIADSGIGVADEQLALLGQRFSRISKNVADGVGLGLSIVQRIAEIHRAKITFNRAAILGGLCVRVYFPLH